MPHLNRELKLNPGPVVSPIPGNTGTAGACYDGDGQALYAVCNNGDMQVWRTWAGYLSLLQQDGSVDFLATILAGPFIDPTTAALTRIDGTVYAVVSGKNTRTLKAGTWIYRDTSPTQDGSGPWVQHGTVVEYTFLPSQTGYAGQANAGGEILVWNGLWAVNFASFADNGSGGTQSSQGVATSSDGGATWTVRLDEPFFFVGSVRGLCWSRNFAQWAGYWYVAGVGQADNFGYSSPDLLTWTKIGPVDQKSFPISTPSLIYRTGGLSLDFAAAPPESLPTWTVGVSPLPPIPANGPYHHYSNIASANNPVYAAFVGGLTMRISDSETVAPPCRLYPREDGLATSSATRIFPQPRSQQGGFRQAGGTYY